MNETKPPATKPKAGAGKPGSLNSEIQSRIGHQLRAMYDDVVKQGIPERFADLLRQLDGPDPATETAVPGAAQKNDGRD